MRLASKLRLAYLFLLLIPFLILGSVVFITYYLGSSSLGPYRELDAPGWLKPELAAIMQENWAAYSKLPERSVIFVMSQDGYLSFPSITDKGTVPADYPHIDPRNSHPIAIAPDSGEDGAKVRPMDYLPGLFVEYGTGWTLDISITPISVNDVPYMVGWKTPRHGIAGFMNRKSWLAPLFVLTGILLIPAFIDAKLRKSVKRLQNAAVRLSAGSLDEPIVVLRKDDLADLARSLESTRVELKDSRERKARFLMAVSHDLRTPLTSIKGYIEALGDGMAETPEEFNRYLSVLQEKTGLLENRIGELIDFARADSGGWKRPSDEIDARQFMNNLDVAFRQDSGFSGRVYNSKIDIPEGTIIDGDSDTLYRAWENLYSNAAGYTETGEPISFQVSVDAGNQPGDQRFLQGEIVDSGPGIDEDFVSLLFEPFARADRGRNTEGLGLGLASVKAVAEAHGGTADYRQAPGGGSIFRISIPCRSA